MVTCLSGVTDCHGQLIDNFRYWMLQMAMMDKILEVCPNMQYGSLKNIVRNTSMFQYTIWAGIKDVTLIDPEIDTKIKEKTFQLCF